MPIVHKSAMDHYATVFAQTFRRSKFAASDGEPFDMAAEFLDITRANTAGLPARPRSRRRRTSSWPRPWRTCSGRSSNPLVFLFQHERGWTPYGRWTRDIAAVYDRLALLIERKQADEPRRDALSILCRTPPTRTATGSAPRRSRGELHALFSGRLRDHRHVDDLGAADHPRHPGAGPSTTRRSSTRSSGSRSG